MSVTTEESLHYHHLPEGSLAQSLPIGTPLRELLRALRMVTWGDLGGLHKVELSDGTFIAVELTPGPDHTYPVASQRIARIRWDDYHCRFYTVRYYPL